MDAAAESTEEKAQRAAADKCRRAKGKQEADNEARRARRSKRPVERDTALLLDDFKVGPERLKELLVQHKKWLVEHPTETAGYFADANRSILKSLILFYVNSGCLRFDRWKDHSKEHDGVDVSVEELVEELERETVQDSDVADIVEKFMDEHSYTSTCVFACASCGRRGHESKDSAWTRFHLNMESPVAILQYDETEKAALKAMKEDPSLLTLL